MRKIFCKIAHIVTVFLAAVSIFGCSSLSTMFNTKEKVDPTHLYYADGFQFRFALSGEWFMANSQAGFFEIGQRPLADGSTKLAVVSYGPMGTPGGKPMSNQDLIDVFKLKVEAGAKGDRVSDIKTRFSERKFKNASCLLFYQSGIDNSPEGKKSLSNNGMICIHPTRAYRFIWMAVSARGPLEGKPFDTSADEKSFFETLDFN